VLEAPGEVLELVSDELLELLEPDVPVELPLGLVPLPTELPALELSERIANSTRPEFGLMMVSLMVPSV
jgi:hypothetical protein